MDDNLLIVNGVVFPTPDKGFKITSTQGVDGGKNSLNAFVGQKVGRRQWKFEGLQWTDLTVEKWEEMLNAINDFVVPVTFTDDRNKRRTISMYPGDTSATPARLDKNLKYVLHDVCSMNLIDCGYDEEEGEV